MNFRKKTDQFKGHRGKVFRKQLYGRKKTNREIIDEEIESLNAQLEQFQTSKKSLFTEFPLSKKTLKGLSACNFEKPTDIQRESIALALNGNDILGAAKTGSGKTLAFIIPVLECLYKLKWSNFDGLGALIISPTRELAFQTFEVLKKVGKFHDFSAGLVIGGKPLKEEAGRINRTNIVVCTPGRLLQHMDETTYFHADNLKILVLDEADRILDLGFAQTMNAIIENLPAERQTLLFSATQTRSVKDLARLSLQDPMYVSVHENATESTPEQLEQSYVVCELHDKLNMLWSFLKNHLKSKILVFLTSCKQVKYVHEAMRHLQPGIPIFALHGGMPQLRRVEVYNQFMCKERVCLFATDIAARGLDFPAVNWVVQLDCPEDANTYIHRAGRTARYEKDGESLLVLLPSEEENMVKQLKEKKIPVEKIRVNQQKLYTIQPKLEANCAADPELKASAQRAFVSYLRSIFLMKNKKVFDVHSLDIEKFARSLGLAIAPKVRFLKKDMKRKEELKNKGKKESVDLSKLEKEKKSSDESGSDSGDSSDSDESDNDSKTGYKSDDEHSSNTENEKLKSDITTTGVEKPVGVKHSPGEQRTNTDIVVRVTQTGRDKIDSKQSEKKIEPDSSESNDSDDDNDETDDDSGDDSEEESEHIDSGEESDDENESEAQPEPTRRTMKEMNEGSEFNFDVEEGEDDELFRVKRNVDIDEVLGDKVIEIEQEESKSKKRRQALKQNKELQALKLWRKNIKVNTKVTFDEEGQVKVDPHKVPQVDVDTEKSENLGGIDLEQARKRMQAEDEVDKQIYREKIKQKHREQRLKQKEERRAKKGKGRQLLVEEEDDPEARLPSEDDDDMKPDPLSFLPDPDKVYGEKDSDSESDSYGPSVSKKVKVENQSKSGLQSSDSSSDDSANSDEDSSGSGYSEADDVMDTELSLKDDEEIALRLLRGK